MEWIKYHEAEKVFDLRTENSTYQMQVREYDTLVHLYYGCPVGDSLITDRIVCVDRGFSGNPYEAGKDKTFSLDTLPQEYTAYGNGDYRINGLEVEQADGSDTANLKFESYEITKGKYSRNCSYAFSPRIRCPMWMGSKVPPIIPILCLMSAIKNSVLFSG